MKKQGFTLIEILITVGIVGLLSSIASLAIMQNMTDSKIKKAETELEMISAAVLQLAWDTGRFPNQKLRTTPGSKEIWDLAPALVGLLGEDEAFPNWNGPYMDDITADPWGNPYFFDPDYRVDGEMRIVVGSFGPNKIGPNRYDEDDIVILLDD